LLVGGSGMLARVAILRSVGAGMSANYYQISSGDFVHLLRQKIDFFFGRVQRWLRKLTHILRHKTQLGHGDTQY
jgi:hypothetical protein